MMRWQERFICVERRQHIFRPETVTSRKNKADLVAGSSGAVERTAGVKAVKRLFDELGDRYKDRDGGYTRIIRIVDAARVTMLN